MKGLVAQQTERNIGGWLIRLIRIGPHKPCLQPYRRGGIDVGKIDAKAGFSQRRRESNSPDRIPAGREEILVEVDVERTVTQRTQPGLPN